MREEDGLALSSRNVRLTPEERAIAPAFAHILFKAAERIVEGDPVDAVLADARSRIVAAGYDKVEYLELRSSDGLVPLAGLSRPARLLAAAWLGETRLIDNVPVQPRAR